MVTKSVGTAGTLEITDDGTRVRFYIHCSDPQTNTGSYKWTGTVNGSSVSGNVALPKGFGTKLLGSWVVSTSQTVTLNQTGTGTQGIGGAASLSMTISRTTVPGKPAKSTLVSATETSLTLKITAPSNGGASISTYGHQLSTSAGTGGLIQSWESSATNHTRTGLTRGRTYYHRYRARNSKGWGAWSDWSALTTAHSIPDVPPAVTLTARTATSLSYSAGNPSYTGGGITGREVQLWTVGTFTSLVDTRTTATGTFTGLSRNTRYTIRQRVRNAKGWSDWTTGVEFRTLYDPPAAPTGYTPYDIASTSAWTTPGSLSDNGGSVPTAMRIQVNTTPTDVGASTFFVQYFDSVPITGLVKGTQYHYRIAAHNGSAVGDGWGPYGAWKSFTTKSNVPSAPVDLSASSITNNTALLTWDAPDSLNGSTVQTYHIRVSSSPVFGTDLQSFTLPATELAQALGNLEPGTWYYAQIWTTSSNGLGSASPGIAFMTEGGAPEAPGQTWVRVGGVWRSGTAWAKIATDGAFPNLFVPGDSSAYPDYSNGTWMPVTIWVKADGIWRTA